MKDFRTSLRYSKAGRFIRYYGKQSGLTLITIVALLGVVAATQLVARRSFENSQAADVMMDSKLSAQAMTEGKVRVLVRLNTNFQSEPTLSESAKSSQRADIAGKAKAVKEALSGIEHKVVHEYKSIPWVAIEVTPQALVKLQSLKGTVLEVKEDLKGEVLAADDYQLVPMRTQEARDLGYDGTGQVVAVIDSGFELRNPKIAPYFSGVILKEICVTDCPPDHSNFAEGSGVAKLCETDGEIDGIYCNHGTEVASMIAINDPTDTLHGVADGAKIIPIKIFKKTCTAEGCVAEMFMSDAIRGLEWAYDNRDIVDVVNMSVGFIPHFASYCDNSYLELKNAVDQLNNSNIPVVTGTGNDGYTNQIAIPACFPSVIPVGSTGTRTGENMNQISPFSNRAPWHSNMLLASGYVDKMIDPFNAPATSPQSGTSFSAPLAAGSYALLNQAVYNAPVSEKILAFKETGLKILDTQTSATYSMIQIDKAAMWLRRFGKPSTKVGTAIQPSPTQPNRVVAWSHNPDGLVTSTAPYVNMAVVTAGYQPRVENITTQITGVTYCGQAMQRIGGTLGRTQFGRETVEAFYLLNPPTTTCTVDIQFNGNPGLVSASAVVLHNVDSQTPIVGSALKFGLSASTTSTTSNAIKNSSPNTNNAGTVFSCVVATIPANTTGVLTGGTIPIDSYSRSVSFGSFGSGTDPDNGILSQFAMNYQRTEDNTPRTLQWASGATTGNTRYPWALLCFNIKVKPFASTTTTPTPTPIPTPTPAPLPGTPTLSSPGNGVTITDATPTFSWTKPANAVAYRIQVSEDSGFSNTAINTTVTTLNYTPTSNLAGGKVYYWRVQGINHTNDAGSWSVVRNFTLISTVAPTLEAPSNGELLNTVRPTFNWNDIPLATNYIVQVSPNAAFSSYTVNITTSTPSSTYTHTSDFAKNSTYYWRVRPKFGTLSGTMSAVSTFKTASPPNVPTLNLPSNGALLTPLNSRTNNVLRPKLSWTTTDSTTVSDPVKYDIQLSKVSTFSSIYLERNNISGTDMGGSTATSIKRYWDVDQDLANGTVYYWRVRAISSAGHKSSWSSGFSFKIPLSAPQLGSPQPNTTPIDLRPTFMWGSVPGATGYTLEVTTGTSFSTKVINVTLSGATNTQYTHTSDLARSTDYYWRVRANSSSFGTAYSETRTFRTPNTPNKPTLSSPASGTTVNTLRPTFRWSTAYTSSIPQPTGYAIQISTINTFPSTALVVNASTAGNPVPPLPTGTSGLVIREWSLNSVNLDLKRATTYYWRVRASVTGGYVSPWSNTFNFKTY